MQEEKYIIIPNKHELKSYNKYGFNSFVLPLKDYSIGFNTYYTIDEINKLSNKYEIYVIMNKFLHMSVYDFKSIYSNFNKNIKFIVEDIGLINIISKDRFILYENHILSNYKAINYLSDLGINNVVINNDLTIDELTEIEDKTKSNLYYFYTSKNTLMYSRRALVTNFNKHYNINNDINSYLLKENISKKDLEIKEEDYGSIVKNHNIFCASKYLDKLNNFYKIIDFSDIDEVNEKMILENYNNTKLCDLILSDYYFLEHSIKYKVGDLK